MEKIKGSPNAGIIDVLEVMDMFLPGMVAYRAILANGAKMEIPNLRDPKERVKWQEKMQTKQ